MKSADKKQDRDCINDHCPAESETEEFVKKSYPGIDLGAGEKLGSDDHFDQEDVAEQLEKTAMDPDSIDMRG